MIGAKQPLQTNGDLLQDDDGLISAPRQPGLGG